MLALQVAAVIEVLGHISASITICTKPEAIFCALASLEIIMKGVNITRTRCLNTRRASRIFIEISHLTTESSARTVDAIGTIPDLAGRSGTNLAH